MRVILLILVAFFTFTNTHGQEITNSEITKNWRLIEGWFPDENLRFKVEESDEAHYIFKFNEDSTIEFRLDREGTDCMVGETLLREGEWTLEKDILTLELKGLVVSDYYFWWKVKYKVVFEQEYMTLNVVEVIKNKEIPPSKTWDDLITD